METDIIALAGIGTTSGLGIIIKMIFTKIAENKKDAKEYTDALINQLSNRNNEKIEEIISQTEKRIEHIEKSYVDLQINIKELIKSVNELNISIAKITK